MRLNIKKIVIGSAVIVGILFFIYFLILPKAPPSGFIPKPLIPKNIQGTVKITPKFTESDFKFPSSVPLINIESLGNIRENEAQEIGKKFGYSTIPDKVEDVFDGTTYLWSGTKDSLVIYAKSRKIEYSINNISKVANKNLSDEAIKSIAKDFLTSKLAINQDDFEFAFFTFLKEAGQSAEGINITNKENASIYQVNYTPKATNIKLLTLDPNASPLNVWVLPDGTVARSSVVKLGKLTNSQNSYPIKNYNQVITSLNDSVIVSLDDGNVNLPNIKSENIENIDISSIAIAYLLTKPSDNLLQPIYTLSGTAKIKGVNKTVSAFLYLPAIANP